MLRMNVLLMKLMKLFGRFELFSALLRLMKRQRWSRLRWWVLPLTAVLTPLLIWGFSLNTPMALRETAAIAQTATPEATDEPAIALSPPDIQAVLDRGELIVAVLGKNNQPFFQEDSAEFPCTTDPALKATVVKSDGKKFCGLDIELGKAIADALDVEVRFDRSAQTFNEVVERVYDRQADLAFSKISRTMSRVRKVSFSIPYVNMRQGLLINRLEFAKQTGGRTATEVLRELEGKIGVIQDSSYVGFTAEKFPDAEVEEYPAWDDIIKAAREGEILAAYRDELEVKKIIRTYPDTALNFQTVALSDTNDAIAAVLPWDSLHLKELVNQYLKSHHADHAADELLDRYEYMFTGEKASTKQD